MEWSPEKSAPKQITDGGIYLPPGAIQSNDGSVKVLMNVIGPSGVGKSWLVNQMRSDPEYGPSEVMVLTNEQATASYGVPLPIQVPVTSLLSIYGVLEDMVRAAEQGKRLPKITFVDSLTGATDYTQAEFNKNPNMVYQKESQSWARDKRSEYGDLGAGGRDIYLLLRRVPTDVVVLMTSHEGAFSPIPEIACEGKLIPKNVSRWSSATLYMKAEEVKVDAEDVKASIVKDGVPAHRTIGRDAHGEPTGLVINRYFITQNTGEIVAKGHVSLGLRERAILPDVIRKIRNYKA